MPAPAIELSTPFWNGQNEPTPANGLIFYTDINSSGSNPQYPSRISWKITNFLGTTTISVLGRIRLCEMDGSSLDWVTPDPGGEPATIEFNQYQLGLHRGGHFDWYPKTSDTGISNTNDRRLIIVADSGNTITFTYAGFANGQMLLSKIGGDVALSDGMGSNEYMGPYDQADEGVDLREAEITRTLSVATLNEAILKAIDTEPTRDIMRELFSNTEDDGFGWGDSIVKHITMVMDPNWFSYFTLGDSLRLDATLTIDEAYTAGDTITPILDALRTESSYFQASSEFGKELTRGYSNFTAFWNPDPYITITLPKTSATSIEEERDLILSKLETSNTGIGSAYPLTLISPISDEAATSDIWGRLGITSTRSSVMNALEVLILDISKIISSALKLQDDAVLEATKDLDDNLGISAAHDMYWIRYLTEAMEKSDAITKEISYVDNPWWMGYVNTSTSKELTRTRYLQDSPVHIDNNFLEVIKLLNNTTQTDSEVFSEITVQEFYHDNQTNFEEALERYIDMASFASNMQTRLTEKIDLTYKKWETVRNDDTAVKTIAGWQDSISRNSDDITNSITNSKRSGCGAADNAVATIEYPVGGTLRYRFSAKPIVTVDETYNNKTLQKDVLDLNTGMLGGYADLEWHGRRIMERTGELSSNLGSQTQYPIIDARIWDLTPYAPGEDGPQWDGTGFDYVLSNATVIKINYLSNRNITAGVTLPKLVIKFGIGLVVKVLEVGEDWLFVLPGEHLSPSIKRVGYDLGEMYLGSDANNTLDSRMTVQIDCFGYGAIPILNQVT